MDRGLWNSVHPDILSVHFVSDQQYASPPNQGNLPNPSSLDPTSNNTESGASRIVGDDVAVWPWIVLSIATFFLCCFMAWLVRLARQGKRRAPNKDITGQQQRQQQRVVQSRSLTFDSDGPAMSAGGTFIHHHPTKTVPPLDPIIGSFAGGLSFGDFPMSPTLSDPYSVDPFMHEDSGEQQQLQHIYVPPRSSDFDDKAYDAFDRLLKVVALQGNSSSSGSSSDGESEMRAVQSSD